MARCVCVAGALFHWVSVTVRVCLCVCDDTCSGQYLFNGMKTSQNTVTWFTCPDRAVTQSWLGERRITVKEDQNNTDFLKLESLPLLSLITPLILSFTLNALTWNSGLSDYFSLSLQKPSLRALSELFFFLNVSCYYSNPGESWCI